LVENGRQALEVVRRHRPAAIVTDLQMPEVNGVELVAAVRGDELTREVPIVVTSAVGSAADWRMLRQMGANDFLLKPMNPDTLVSTVIRYVRQHTKRR
jgi:CheY-like chemotaxis protein